MKAQKLRPKQNKLLIPSNKLPFIFWGFDSEQTILFESEITIILVSYHGFEQKYINNFNRFSDKNKLKLLHD